MKHILLIATGGTIAAKRTDSGLAPMLESDEVLKYVPSLLGKCRIDTIQIFKLDSTNIEPNHWLKMAETIEKYYEDYDGFVMLHGTDTMAYTAAALSYLIQDAGKPIVITGSQRPIEGEVTDAKLNVSDSFLYAMDDNSYGVNIVFDGHVIAGTRARKTRSKSFNAFSSINYPDIAEVRNNKIIRYINDAKPPEPVKFYRSLNEKVFLLKLIPGQDAHIFKFLKTHYDILVLESFGVGGIPSNEADSFMAAIKDWLQSGKVIAMATQVPHEGSEMGIYSVGSRIKEEFNIFEAYDMTLEALVTKLMWLYRQKDCQNAKELFYQPVNHDIII